MRIHRQEEVKAIALRSEQNLDPFDKIIILCATITEDAYIRHKS